jgi:hypothetical protein
MSAVGPVSQSIPPQRPANNNNANNTDDTGNTGNNNIQPPTSNGGGDTYDFKSGDTVSDVVSSKMPGASAGDQWQKTLDVLQMNGLDLDSARNMPVGFQLKLPPDLSQGSDDAGKAAQNQAPQDAPQGGQQQAAPKPLQPQVQAAPRTAQPQQVQAAAPRAVQPQVAAAPQVNQAAPAPRVAQPQPAANLATRRNNPSQLTVAVVDTFARDKKVPSFVHGNEIIKTLQNGGADPSLRGKVNILKYSVDGPESLTQGLAIRTAAALQDIIRRIQGGADIDAVNMSLQDFNATKGANMVRVLLGQLAQMNVPVLVAAGNGGPNMQNQLVNPSEFIFQSATNGRLNATSGRGNITGQASTTSFATAALTPHYAALANAGLSLQQLRALSGIR